MKRLLLLYMAAAVCFAQSALYVDLSGEWRIKQEDQPAFAQADFDDSGWSTLALPRPQNSNAFRRGFGPGAWWIRHSVALPAGADKTRLAITLGPIGEMYEVFVNGLKIGATGPLNSYDAQVARPRTFAVLPDAAANATRLQIAVRVMIGQFPATIFYVPEYGPYLLTYLEHAPADAGSSTIEQWRWFNSSWVLLTVLRLFIAVIILLAWISERDRLELLWLGLFLAASSAWYGQQFLLLGTDTFPGRQAVTQRTFILLNGAMLAQLVAITMKLRARWLHMAIWIAWASGFFFWGRNFLHGRLMAAATFGILLGGWVKQGGFRQSFERQLVATALALAVINMGNTAQSALFAGTLYFAGYRWSTNALILTVLAVILATLLLRRLVADRTERRRLSSEMEAARVVQQLLLSDTAAPAGPYEVQAEYRPAQEVGGDFYQVLTLSDGGLLVAVGDVSGKGLKAAMVVSMMTGVLRSHRNLTPARLLEVMNETLGRSFAGGFVTCLIARFEPGGAVTIANAGHLAPYSAETEVALNGGLPLGVAASEFEEARLHLAPGKAITFLTDGVVEAANAKGELLGFDRARSISGKSSDEIAEAATAWGQNDDITVVTVRRS